MLEGVSRRGGGGSVERGQCFVETPILLRCVPQIGHIFGRKIPPLGHKNICGNNLAKLIIQRHIPLARLPNSTTDSTTNSIPVSSCTRSSMILGMMSSLMNEDFFALLPMTAFFIFLK